MRNNQLSAMIFCALLGFSGVAFAQETDPAKLFDTAETYYNVGEWEQALKNYKEAYILSKEPLLLYNMGQCYRQMNKYDDAIRTYKNFLKEVPDTTQRPTVEKFIKELEEKKAATKPEPVVRPEVVPEVKPEIKPEVKPVVEPVVTPEVKPEVKPEIKPEVKPVVEPEVKPINGALLPVVEPQEKPTSNKKVFLYAGIGGGVVIAGVLTGLLLSRSNEELESTFGTFTPFSF
jgi:tetratricopeptide (TPR) repeat protein